MNSSCRVCLLDKNNVNETEFISIFETDQENENISSKIMKCAKVQISGDDIFPKEICLNCVNNLGVAYKFKVQCEKSDETFRVFLSTNFDKLCFDENELKVNGDLICVKNESEKYFENVSSTDEKFPATQKHSKNLNKEKSLISVSKLDTKKVKRSARFLEKKKKIEIKEEPLEDDFIVKLELDDENYNSFSEDLAPEETIVSKKKKARGRPKKVYRDNSGTILPEKPQTLLVCDQCGRSFKLMESLRGHQRRHTGEKPFMCSTCGKSFHVLNELKKHLNTHSGVKPYKCKYCDRRFTDWGSRFKHERCHRGERPYQCDVCPKSFSYSYVLNRHKLTHSGDKKFSCDICKKNFTLKYHLTNHNKKYHKDSEKTEQKPVPETNPVLHFSMNLNNEHEIKHSNDTILNGGNIYVIQDNSHVSSEKAPQLSDGSVHRAENNIQELDVDKLHNVPIFDHVELIPDNVHDNLEQIVIDEKNIVKIKDDSPEKYLNIVFTRPRILTKCKSIRSEVKLQPDR